MMALKKIKNNMYVKSVAMKFLYEDRFGLSISQDN